jgi:vacuolar-type H+-ATPase subunit E/Vma4
MTIAASMPAEAERLAALIAEQAAAEAAQVEAEGRKRAQETRAAAEAEARRIDAAAQAEAQERGRRQASQIVAAARAGGRLEWLRAREALIEEAIEQARTQLADVQATEDTAEVVAGLVGEALAVLPHGALRLRLSPAWTAQADEIVRRIDPARSADLQIEPDAVPGGGVIVETPDAHLRFDNSFDARLCRQRQHIRRLVGALLFSGESAEDRSKAAGATAERAQPCP